jgi:hypothetical protein
LLWGNGANLHFTATSNFPLLCPVSC